MRYPRLVRGLVVGVISHRLLYCCCSSASSPLVRREGVSFLTVSSGRCFLKRTAHRRNAQGSTMKRSIPMGTSSFTVGGGITEGVCTYMSDHWYTYKSRSKYLSKRVHLYQPCPSQPQ